MPTADPSKKKTVAKSTARAAAESDAISTGLETESPDLVATEFAVGDHVMHRMFGAGRIVSTRDDKLTIDFDKAGKKEILDIFVKRA